MGQVDGEVDEGVVLAHELPGRRRIREYEDRGQHRSAEHEKPNSLTSGKTYQRTTNKLRNTQGDLRPQFCHFCSTIYNGGSGKERGGNTKDLSRPLLRPCAVRSRALAALSLPTSYLVRSIACRGLLTTSRHGKPSIALGPPVAESPMSLASSEDMPLLSLPPPSGCPRSYLPRSPSPSPATPVGRSSTAPG